MRKTPIAILITLALTALPALASNDPHFGKQWGLQRIGAPQAWAKGTGEGIIIAIVDTGIYFPHEDLNASWKFVPGKDYIDEEPPQDEDGHGTHVAGIAAALTENGVGVAGVAPRARLMSVRVLNQIGANVTTQNVTVQNPEVFADTAAAVRWATDHGARVINMSFGPIVNSGPDPGFVAALQYAWSKKAIPVVAAGNDDGEDPGYTNENAIVVVATTKNTSDAKASYSNIAGNAKWAISAPGSGIYSATCCSQDIQDRAIDGYVTLSGTSMAAPHVSGAAAVLLGMGLTPQQVVDRLMATAKDLGPTGPDTTYGHGRLDLAKAVEGLGGAKSVSSPKPVSSVSTTTSGGITSGGSTSPAPGTQTSTKNQPPKKSPDDPSRADEVQGAEVTGTASESKDGEKPDINWVMLILAIFTIGIGVYPILRMLPSLFKEP